jgi:ABC-type nickel/cobalt efflux system permease component RcnA
MTDPPTTSKAAHVRNTSYVSLCALALTVISAAVFSHEGVPLKSSADYAVVAGFWLVIVGSGWWLWKRIQQRSRKDKSSQRS